MEASTSYAEASMGTPGSDLESSSVITVELASLEDARPLRIRNDAGAVNLDTLD